MSDMDIGGFSTVRSDFVPANGSEPPHMRFHGAISTQLPVGLPEVQRTGYAGWRTLDKGWSMFGKSYWDIDRYRFLALRVKSDGRKYFVNLQSDTIVPTDLHQHRLYTTSPGEWETVLIDFSDFVRTNHGMVVEPQSELMRQKVMSVGISSTDRIPGPFDLSISDIWATNRLSQQEKLESAKTQDYNLAQQSRDRNAPPEKPDAPP